MSLNISKGFWSILKKWAQFFEAFLVEFVDIVDHTLFHDAGIDELSAVWCCGKILKDVSVIELWMLLDHDNVFNSDTEFSVLIVSWFVGNAHALAESNISSSGNADWTLMNTQKTTNTMPSSVLIIKTSFEKIFPSQNFEILTSKGGIAWPDNSFEFKVTH